MDDAIDRINEILAENEHNSVIITGCIASIEQDRIRKALRTSSLTFQSFEDLVKTHTVTTFQAIDQRKPSIFTFLNK